MAWFSRLTPSKLAIKFLKAIFCEPCWAFSLESWRNLAQIVQGSQRTNISNLELKSV
jgi:hypothetical protein